jgi:hypothetical protein
MPSIPGLESLPATLNQRINRRNNFTCPIIDDSGSSNNDDDGDDQQSLPNKSFVLYLPTVVLRKQHNPAFAVACHLANAHKVPLVVLAVVLDDAHLPSPLPQQQSQKNKPIVFTARRIAFVLEALQEATKAWEDHGAGVAVRVHGPQARAPHHLTLALKALAVVTDEPFVHPYRHFVDSIERAVHFAKVPLFAVDGSTTVPPLYTLHKKTRDSQGRVVYLDVPTKAWRWDERTKAHRQEHVLGAVKDGHFDAPPLRYKLASDFFVNTEKANNNSNCRIQDSLPAAWKEQAAPSPGKRPWTVSELGSISSLKEWVMHWPGIDTSVPPCPQTHGSTKAGMDRWNRFLVHHMGDYAKLRNQITNPHAVSRMSCYLNYGVVSIFQVVHDTWASKKGKSFKGASKFEDEVVKWREIGYVHTFASPEYNLPSVVPVWAAKWIKTQQDNSGASYSLEALETGSTRDDKWNAMQQYLVETGELHNNARMTWGKSMVHWQKHDFNLAEILHQMVYVNDRYALDGLSPPSYAGLLWCFGWCDKPSNASKGAISEKAASRYRTGSSGFLQANHALLTGVSTSAILSQSKKQAAGHSASAETNELNSPSKRQKSIDSFFRVGG